MNSQQYELKSTIAIGLLQVVLFLGTVQLFTDISAPSAKPPTPRSQNSIAKLKKTEKTNKAIFIFRRLLWVQSSK